MTEVDGGGNGNNGGERGAYDGDSGIVRKERSEEENGDRLRRNTYMVREHHVAVLPDQSCKCIMYGTHH